MKALEEGGGLASRNWQVRAYLAPRAEVASLLTPGRHTANKGDCQTAIRWVKRWAALAFVQDLAR
jgi:hypothetical protein